MVVVSLGYTPGPRDCIEVPNPAAHLARRGSPVSDARRFG
jgi:hypothetical protein